MRGYKIISSAGEAGEAVSAWVSNTDRYVDNMIWPSINEDETKRGMGAEMPRPARFMVEAENMVSDN